MTAIRTLWSITCTATLAAAALLNPATASAFPLVVTAGFGVESGGRWCTISFVDPYTPRVAYTASHCYIPGYPKAMFGRFYVGYFVPEISSDYPDLIAIRLSDKVTSDRRLITGEQVIAGIQPVVGEQVCKWGITTAETCGTVIESTPTRMAVAITAEHGDSGAPIYIRTRGTDSRSGIYIVGTVYANSKTRPGVLIATPMPMIDMFLSTAYGLTWNM